MMQSKGIQNKSYISYFPKILLASLLIIISFLITSNTLTVYADHVAVDTANGGGTGGNATDEDSKGGKDGYEEGPSYYKQFWLAYITDESGTPQTDVVLIRPNDFLNVTMDYYITRPEHGSVKATKYRKETPKYGWAFEYDQNNIAVGRGSHIKQYLISPELNYPVYDVIKDYWGEETAEAFSKNDWYFCLEAGMYCGAYINRTYTGNIFAGTAYGWGFINNHMSELKPEWAIPYGDWSINLYTNQILAKSTFLEFDQTGIKAPTSGIKENEGRISNQSMMDYGYGMLIVWSGETGETGTLTHTWDKQNHPSDEADPPLPHQHQRNPNPTSPFIFNLPKHIIQESSKDADAVSFFMLFFKRLVKITNGFIADALMVL